MKNKPPLKRRAVDGKIVRSDKSQGGVFVEDFGLPPKVRGLSLPTAIGRQLSYWGLRRTFDAYALAIKAGVSAGETVRELYEVSQSIEYERERWMQVDAIREMARRSIKLEMLDQEKQLRTAQLEVDNLKTEQALQELQNTIIKNNKEVEFQRTQTALAIEERAQKEIEDDQKGENLDELLENMFETYGKNEQIDEFRTRLIKQRGGEENLTEEDTDFLDHAQDLVRFQLSKTAEM